MDAAWIIPAVVVIAPLMEHLGHRRDVRAHVPDSEILTIAVVAAGYVGNHHERAAPMMREFGYLSGRIGVSRFHRRLHPLADGMSWIPANVGGASPRATGSLSIASPRRSAVVCAPGTFRRRRARMLRGVRGENDNNDSRHGARIARADRRRCRPGGHSDCDVLCRSAQRRVRLSPTSAGRVCLPLFRSKTR